MAMAEQCVKQGLELDLKLVGPGHPAVVDSMSNMATLLGLQGKHAEAEDMYLRALVVAEQTHGAQHLEVRAAGLPRRKASNPASPGGRPDPAGHAEDTHVRGHARRRCEPLAP